MELEFTYEDIKANYRIKHLMPGESCVVYGHITVSRSHEFYHKKSDHEYTNYKLLNGSGGNGRLQYTTVDTAVKAARYLNAMGDYARVRETIKREKREERQRQREAKKQEKRALRRLLREAKKNIEARQVQR